MNDSAKAMSAPVLFLVFNRPAETGRVFEAIAAARPRQLFVAADGPRSEIEGELERCLQVRGIIDSVDWECEVKTLFREDNLGCGKAVSGAISWFFEHVEEGIILEDDCLPLPEFFPYCESLLLKYRDQEDVMMIGGSNFQPPENQKSCQYYFSKIPHIWGWATWRRAWQQYDYSLSSLPSYIGTGRWRDLSEDPDVCFYWMKSFCATHSGLIDTWDYQCVYAILARAGLSITPGVNLIQNISISADATHTRNGFAPEVTALDVGEFESLPTPQVCAVNHAYDNYTLCTVLNAKFQTIQNRFLRWRKNIRRRIRVKRIMKQIQGSSKL